MSCQPRPLYPEKNPRGNGESKYSSTLRPLYPRKETGSRDTAPRILNLGTRWRLVVSFTPLPLYPREKPIWKRGVEIQINAPDVLPPGRNPYGNREWRYNSTHSEPRHQMKVSGQLHAPAALPPGKKPTRKGFNFILKSVWGWHNLQCFFCPKTLSESQK
jgi:hypothetical protein